MSFRVVIPARYASSRLPGKALRLIGGEPMIRRVYERARQSEATAVLVATDDARIETACRAFGAPVVMTSPEHASGTDRLAEVAGRERWNDEEIIVNVQGDEPLLEPANVTQVARRLANQPWAAIATLVTPLRSAEEFENPNVVKVVIDAAGRALYFSRSAIPWHSDQATSGPKSDGPWSGALRHVGLYAYRCAALKRLATLRPSAAERAERLEQLRALEHGLGIAVAVAEREPGPAVDTEEDLAAAEAEWRRRSAK